MAHCSDPRLVHLNDQGFNVLRLPRPDLKPLDVLGYDGTQFERLGALPQFWQAAAEAPEVKASRSAETVEGTSTRSLKRSIGLSLLTDLLAALGLPAAPVQAAYAAAPKLRFTLAGVQARQVDPFALGAFLASGDLATNHPVVHSFFANDTHLVYLVTEVLQASALTVVALGRQDQPLAIDTTALQASPVTISNLGTQQGAIHYEGAAPLTFAFKAFGLAFANGDWHLEGTTKAGDPAYLQPGTLAQRPEPVLFSPGRLMRI